jgi:H2-forming N5,N10-methylenetetrahydromethanopterin dehydrogenase-like enzyme
VIGGGKFATDRWFSIRIVKRQICPAQADAINRSIKPSLQWFANLVERELDARRAAVDGQDF